LLLGPADMSWDPPVHRYVPATPSSCAGNSCLRCLAWACPCPAALYPGLLDLLFYRAALCLYFSAMLVPTGLPP
jgi:hypothetical protein